MPDPNDAAFIPPTGLAADADFINPNHPDDPGYEAGDPGPADTDAAVEGADVEPEAAEFTGARPGAKHSHATAEHCCTGEGAQEAYADIRLLICQGGDPRQIIDRINARCKESAAL